MNQILIYGVAEAGRLHLELTWGESALRLRALPGGSMLDFRPDNGRLESSWLKPWETELLTLPKDAPPAAFHPTGAGVLLGQDQTPSHPWLGKMEAASPGRSILDLALRVRFMPGSVAPEALGPLLRQAASHLDLPAIDAEQARRAAPGYEAPDADPFVQPAQYLDRDQAPTSVRFKPLPHTGINASPYDGSPRTETLEVPAGRQVELMIDCALRLVGHSSPASRWNSVLEEVLGKAAQSGQSQS